MSTPATWGQVVADAHEQQQRQALGQQEEPEVPEEWVGDEPELVDDREMGG